MCKYCNEETGLSGGAQSNHVAWCHLNPKRQERAKALEKARAARAGKPGTNRHTKALKEGKTVKVSQETRDKISKAGLGRTHSPEMKQHLSEKRKEWLRLHPEDHPWKKSERFKSVPCEALKNLLRSEGFIFDEEYSPIPNRAFSVDIAFPSQKLAIEVNGEQHYNRDGTLRKYYQERHDLIVKFGWLVIELHYAKCYGSHLVETISLIKKYL